MLIIYNSIIIFLGSCTSKIYILTPNLVCHDGLMQFDFNHSIITDCESQSRSKRNITTALLLQLRYFFRLWSCNNVNGVADH